MTKISSTKWQRCSDISIQNRLPFVQLLESVFNDNEIILSVDHHFSFIYSSFVLLLNLKSGLDLDKAFEGFHIEPNWFHR